MQHDIWKSIRDALAARMDDGDLAPGERLPNETDLCRQFGAGRHSVRRAIHALAVEGRLRVVQGSGTFVHNEPLIDYAISRRTRFRSNLAAQGLVPSSEHVSSEIVEASPRIAAALALPLGAQVHQMVRLGCANGTPLTVNMSYHGVERFPNIGAQGETGRSLTDIYRDHGLLDYQRKSTRIFARRPDEAEAALLQQHPDQPVVVLTKVDVALNGAPIGYSETIWASQRVQFSIEFGEEHGGV